MAGDEVVQMDIKDEYASVGRFHKELKDFKRIHLKPGETKMVTFEVGPHNLFFLNKDLKKVVEPGDFVIMGGSSSKDEDSCFPHCHQTT